MVSFRPRIARAAGILALLLILTVPNAATGGSAAPSATAPTLTAAPAAGVPAPGAAPAVIHPSIVCPPTPPPNPAYALLGVIAPPSPIPTYQTPCNLVLEDELHASLMSNQPYSGERFTIPIQLGADTALGAQDAAYYQFALGLVVNGNPDSAWGQSWAEVAFTPSGGTWEEDVAVISLVNDTVFGGSTSESTPQCPNVGTESNYLSWNNTYFCLMNEVYASTTLASGIAGGSSLTVTFAGVKGGSAGLHLWVNDSTSSGLSTSYVFDATTTGNHTYEPAYNSSCLDLCLLHWAYPLGVGALIFPISYEESVVRGPEPNLIGIPQYWVASTHGYTGDYYYVSPESSSGVCNTNAAPGTLAPCNNWLVNGGTGYYPYFTFNGSALNFGANYTWTTVNFGGATSELYANGAQRDLIPFFFTATSNSSLAGFSPPSVAITVDSTVQDLGTATSVTLSYQLNGGTFTNVAMSLTTGTTTNGNWEATIPSSLGNGLVSYYLTAVNHAGATITTPYSGTFHIRRGPLPTFHEVVTTNLLSCGQITFNGTTYPSGSTVSTLPGFFAIFGVGCYPWNFTQWKHTGGVAITPGDQRTAQATIYDNGTINATWTYVRPLDTITIATSPSTCGSVTIASNTTTNGGTLQAWDGLSSSLTETGCAGELFGGWTFTGAFTILGPTLVPAGNGTLTANFVSSSTAVAVDFVTNPASCGGVLFRGAGYTNGETLSLAPGSYDIAPDPCAHYGFLNWTLSGGLSIASGTLTVSSAGIVTENNYRLTEVTFVLNPASCGYVIWDGTVHHNGDVVVVSPDSTHSVYAVNNTGCYVIAISGDSGVHVSGNVAIVNASGNISVSYGIGTPTQVIAFLTDPPTCGSIDFNNRPFYNSNFTTVAQGLQVTISATPCAGYGFVSWLTYGSITIIGSTAYLNSSGAIEAVFKPLVQVFFETLPIWCGSITLAGSTYLNSQYAQVPESAAYPISATPCAGYHLVGWTNTTGLAVSGGSVYVIAGGFLTAIFSQIVYNVTLLLSPPGCGSIRFNGSAPAGNGTRYQLIGGDYPLTALPCSGDHLVNWTVTGGLTLDNGTLHVAGDGTVTAVFEPTPPVVTLTVPTSTLAGADIEFVATVAVLLPPFNYTYQWTFGDGGTATTLANFTIHSYGATGTYVASVKVIDPLGRSATANGTVQVLTGTATNRIALSGFAIDVLAGGALALLAVAVIVLLRRRAENAPRAPPARRTTPPPRPGPKP